MYDLFTIFSLRPFPLPLCGGRVFFLFVLPHAVLCPASLLPEFLSRLLFSSPCAGEELCSIGRPVVVRRTKRVGLSQFAPAKLLLFFDMCKKKRPEGRFSYAWQPYSPTPPSIGWGYTLPVGNILADNKAVIPVIAETCTVGKIYSFLINLYRC